MKKYTDIVRLGHKSTRDVLKEGDQIVIWEKADGANASLTRDGDKIRAFSRNTELSEENNLGGFYQFTQSLNVYDLIPGDIYFGEWLNPHKVKYPEHQKKFFMFDIYDSELGQYIHHNIVRLEANRLGLLLMPIFYEGPYISFEHLQSFVGRTDLGGMLGDIPTGEGIVVKNVDYRDKWGNQMFVKLVTDKFAEVQKQKPAKDPNRPKTQEEIFAEMTVTRARVEKLMHKLVDENVMTQDEMCIENMGKILKNLSMRVYDDVMKEESDSLPEGYDDKVVRKEVGKKVPQFVKEVLNEVSVD